MEWSTGNYLGLLRRGESVHEDEGALAVASPRPQNSIPELPWVDVAHLPLKIGLAAVLHGLGHKGGHGRGVDGNVRRKEGDVPRVVQMGVGDEYAVQP